MSRAFNGGQETYRDEEPPENEKEVIELLSRFIIQKFKSGSEIADQIQSNPNKRILIFLASEGHTNPKMTIRGKGDLVAYGTFSFPAKDHSVQVIWENRFEIENTDEGVFVRVSNWSGPTVKSWNKKLEREKIYL